MKIITVPHPILRQKAQAITQADRKLLKFIDQLKQQLANATDPQGVGLAAPQVAKSWRLFSTQLINKDKKSYLPLQVFINPKIIQQSKKITLGEKKDNPDLEGCLSIPNLYGPVPRFDWIELAYEEINYLPTKKNQAAHQDQNQLSLIKKTEKFTGLNARIIQHERDHLDGILFTDYILRYDLPLYQNNPATNKLAEITDKSLLKLY